MCIKSRTRRMMAILQKEEHRERRNEIYGSNRKVVRNRIMLVLKPEQRDEIKHSYR